jgi:pimeloyl-ACP methyl ester carboxylesterase
MGYLFFTGNQGNQPIRRWYCFTAGLLLLTQYRNLIPALAEHFHIVAPDYPGFGNSDMPSTKEFNYTFDRLSEIIEEFLKAIGFTRFGLFMQDYGGPVGFRIISRHPDWLEWLIIQNTNAYEVGFTKAWDGFRYALWKNRTPETEGPLLAFLQHDAFKQVYLYGHKNPENISPDNWISGSWNVLMRGKYRWICFMTTVLTLHCIHSGRNSYVNVNRKP